MNRLKDDNEFLNLLRTYSPAGQNYAELLLEIEEKSMTGGKVVPVLGMQGSGKSTMINALLGEDILPGEADETTCVPVEISYGEEAAGEVFFSDGQAPKAANSKAELSLYVDNACNPGNEKKVAKVVLHRDLPLLKTGLVLVDLPGVGSLTRVNEETTNRYIKNLCAAIFMIPTVPTIGKSDAVFIEGVWRSFSSAVFVQNVWTGNTKEEVRESLSYNGNNLKKIAEKIHAPLLHEIIPVNVYDAAKGAITKDQTLLQESGIGVLADTLKSFAEHHQEQQERSLKARLEQFQSAALEEIDRRIGLTKVSGEEILESLNREKQAFAKANEEIEEIVSAVQSQLRSSKNEMRSFASETARKYSELLRTEVLHLVDAGVVDGEMLSNAFSEYQVTLASDALDDTYEKYESVYEKLREHLDRLDDILDREEMRFAGPADFNKPQAFKWEKIAEPVISLGGTIGGLVAGAAVGGIPGALVGVGIALVGGLLGSGTRKLTVKERASRTKAELEPYVDEYESHLSSSITDTFTSFANSIDEQLRAYVDEREEQLDGIKKQIREFKENDMKLELEINTLEQDRKRLETWEWQHA